MSSPIGEIRPAQLITTFGPGSIIDAKMDSLTILDLKYWEHPGSVIRDSRLASFLKVSHFIKPRTSNNYDLPVISFPNYHICSRCNLLFDIRKDFDLAQYIKKGPICPACKEGSYPSRFVLSCEANHLDDFPWRWWVHKGDSNCKKNIYIHTTGYTSSLADIMVKCDCGDKRSLTGATDKGSFIGYQCTGNHPFRPGDRKKSCDAPVIPLQRGASNVYFPALRSALSIPPWINPIDELIDLHYSDICAVLKYGGDLKILYNDHFKERSSFEQFNEALKRRQSEIDKYSQIKEMEYDALLNHKDFDVSVEKHFKAEDEVLADPVKPYFNRVIKIHRLREILVLLGFTRNNSPEPETGTPANIVWLSSDDTKRWLPAVDINGEGIFIEFNKEKLHSWRKQIEDKDSKLSTVYSNLYRVWVERRGWTLGENRDAIYVMMHTFAHLLIKELANECGYSSTALKERIYYKENLRMSGVLIYTGTSDLEGSLGGLVEMGNMEKLMPLIYTTLENALFCSNDPLCSTLLPSEETINGSACHSCCMVSETSCENGNTLLDRSLVLSLPERIEQGYFEGLI